MSLPVVLPDDDGIRPADEPGACFYCRQQVGEPHRADCVTLLRRARVRYAFELEVEVPHSFSAHDVEFHRNEGSWCADNALDDLARYLDRLRGEGRCLCNDFCCVVVEMPEAPPYRKNEAGEVAD